MKSDPNPFAAVLAALLLAWLLGQLLGGCAYVDDKVDQAEEACREFSEAALDECRDAKERLLEQLGQCVDQINLLIDDKVTDWLTRAGCVPVDTDLGWDCSGADVCRGVSNS